MLRGAAYNATSVHVQEEPTRSSSSANGSRVHAPANRFFSYDSSPPPTLRLAKCISWAHSVAAAAAVEGCLTFSRLVRSFSQVSSQAAVLISKTVSSSSFSSSESDQSAMTMKIIMPEGGGGAINSPFPEDAKTSSPRKKGHAYPAGVASVALIYDANGARKACTHVYCGSMELSSFYYFMGDTLRRSVGLRFELPNTLWLKNVESLVSYLAISLSYA